ncbi:unnamed protein product [marine sediment metagenome]|uniref:Uncharacterized protein n=1 Tax=marine sediment metagenome TaxID=412755 RepID=X1BXY7_9ZZZZ
MNWYKKAQEFKFEVGRTLTYNYPKAPYKGTCAIQKVNPDGTLDVLDYSGRVMRGLSPYFGSDPMFKEML